MHMYYVAIQHRDAVDVFYSYSQIRHYQVLPFQARVELGAMAMKEYSELPKAPALVEIHLHIV